ncbi:MAG: hypothetical protein ABSB40_04970 [Nitrososphaeria archaeon]
MSSDFSKLEYMQVSNYSGLPVLAIRYVKEYAQLLTEKQPKLIYRCTNERSDEFVFMDNGFYYSFPTYGYNTFADLLEGLKLGFSDCNRKYKVENGQLKEIHEGSPGSSEGEVYYSIRKQGFESFTEFEDAFSKGFPTREMYGEYLKLKKIKDDFGFATFDEAHVFDILNRKSLGRIKSLYEIQMILQTEKPRQENGTPKWYLESLQQEGDTLERDQGALEKFLSTNQQIVNLGVYDPERKEFKNYSITKVIVDGNNVTWSGRNKLAGDRPRARNILLVVQRLREFEFRDILVLCDANLEHEVEDKSVYDELYNSKLIRSVPSKTDAKEFIINYAKEFEARIVTNDNLGDWARADEWVRNHAKDDLIRFIIIHDEVQLAPGLF